MGIGSCAVIKRKCPIISHGTLHFGHSDFASTHLDETLPEARAEPLPPVVDALPDKRLREPNKRRASAARERAELPAFASGGGAQWLGARPRALRGAM